MKASVAARSQLKFVLPTPQPIKLEHPVNMENLQVNDGHGQAYGYTLYETVIPGGGHLFSQGHVRDRAQVTNGIGVCYLPRGEMLTLS